MTKERKIEILKDLLIQLSDSANILCTCEADERCEVVEEYIKALEQQPSEDKITITMNKGTLKYSGQGYVAYKKDWFRKHFATEVAIMTGYDGYKGQPTIEEILSHINTGITATGQSDSYCVGFCNALVWLKSCITHEEPQFFDDSKVEENSTGSTTSDDCVSRQAVKDAVENTIAKYIPILIGRYEKIPLELAVAIRDVPPVTPTRSTCKECKYCEDIGVKTTLYCKRYGINHLENYYCADFEKRGDSDGSN